MEPQMLQLTDGRSLSYAIYGDPNGIPVFYFHGTPGSRFIPSGDLALVHGLGLQLIAPDRPGFGRSDFQPDRRLLDWPDDVVQLADALRLDRFGVLGVSGGGPYAAACAFKLPERLTRVAMVGSRAPYNAVAEPSPLPTVEELEADAESFAQKVRERPDEMYAEIEAELPDADREILQRPDIKEWLIANFREAFNRGVQGYVHEVPLLFARRWDFSLQEITSEVHLWHGGADRNVPVENAHYLAQHIPGCKLHLRPGMGHFVPLEVWNHIFGLFTDAV